MRVEALGEGLHGETGLLGALSGSGDEPTWMDVAFAADELVCGERGVIGEGLADEGDIGFGGFPGVGGFLWPVVFRTGLEQ